MDMHRELRSAVMTGKVLFGLDQTKKALSSGRAKAIIVASNCPMPEICEQAGAARVLMFPGTNIELGAACGKPFAISALAVIEPGESGILQGKT
ncbi:MAG: 50S ribosomal protein L30e [Candidatus Thermoplasmatota archaeon]